MDYRKKAFKEKFKSAQLVFKSKNIEEIISFKFRENTNSSDYSHLIDFMSHDLSLDVVPLTGIFQGQAWLVTDAGGNKNILVEHETGLEILGIAGSIASLIGLLPILNSSWKFLKHKIWDRYEHGIELRKLSDDSLVEQRIQSIENFILMSVFEENRKLTERIDGLEKEVRNMKKLKTLLNNSKNGPLKKP